MWADPKIPTGGPSLIFFKLSKYFTEGRTNPCTSISKEPYSHFSFSRWGYGREPHEP